MVESTVLALLGGTLGITLAVEGIALVRKFGDGLIPRAAAIQFDMPVALTALAAVLATAVIFGLSPALRLSRADLREHAANRITPPDVERRRGLLVSVEVALASVLLIGAGLIGESLMRLLSTNPGLRTDHLLTLRLTLSRSRYPTSPAQNAFLQQALERVNALPGVVDAAEISDTPLQGNNPTFEFSLEGIPHAPSDPPIQAGLRAVSANYLPMARIPLLRGRYFTVDDRATRLPVAVVNQTMAQLHWPGANPIGQRIRFKEDQRWLTVAGVVADIKHLGLKADEGPVVYIPYDQKVQDWLAWTTLLVRTSADPMDSITAVRSAIREIDRNQPVADIGTLDGWLTRSTALPRFTTVVIAARSPDSHS